MKWEVEFGMLTAAIGNFHLRHTRKGPPNKKTLKVPFIIHPLQVLQRVQRWGIDEPTELNKAFWKGLLAHDTLEDTAANFEALVALLGFQAATISLELTQAPDQDEQEYITSFDSKSIESLVGKIADRLCNVEDFLKDNPGYCEKYFHKADAVFAVFKERKDEVIARFGLDVCSAIEEDIQDVLTRVSEC